MRAGLALGIAGVAGLVAGLAIWFSAPRGATSKEVPDLRFQEMPALDRLQAELGGPGFEVLALSIEWDAPEMVEDLRRAIEARH